MNWTRRFLNCFVVALFMGSSFCQAQSPASAPGQGIASGDDPAQKRRTGKGAEGAATRPAKEKRGVKDAGEDDVTSAPTGPPPTYPNVSYGTHERDVLDTWLVHSDRPTPVVIYFHGGGFKGGDKSIVMKYAIFKACLQNRVAIVSANYRLSTDAPYPAPMLDGARAVQFVRWKAKEWNIDPERVAVSGSSAGGALALWIAMHDDLADPKSTDLVARYSTRVSCVVGYVAAGSMEPEYITKYSGLEKPPSTGINLLFGTTTIEGLSSPKVKELVRDASAINHLTKDDPPLWLTYSGRPEDAPFPKNAPKITPTIMHHVCLGMPLKRKCDELGIECRLYHQTAPAPEGSELEFLRRYLIGEQQGGQR